MLSAVRVCVVHAESLLPYADGCELQYSLMKLERLYAQR